MVEVNVYLENCHPSVDFNLHPPQFILSENPNSVDYNIRRFEKSFKI